MDSNSSEEADRSRSESPLFTPPRATPSPLRDSDVGHSFGRPRKSPVWDYFNYDSNTNKSVCQILKSSTESSSIEEASACGQSLAGKFATNLKSHLKKSHPKEYQQVLSREAMTKEKVAKKPKRQESQMTLCEAIQRKYDTKSPRCQQITRKLAIFVGSTNVPNSLVENMEFRSLVETLDPRYPMPSRTLISKEIDKVLFDVKANIQIFLSEAQKVSLCSDIWTKKGMTSSYLGITAHFFSRRDHKRHRVTLAVRRMPHPHNAVNIRDITDQVLQEWNIPHSKILAILTDNASNMLKAFQQELHVQDSEDENEELPPDDEDYEEDFETREQDHDLTFKTFGKRLSCFAHTLQLVVNKFSHDSSFASTMKKVNGLVKKVNKSSRATEQLLSECRKKLISSCPTRWSSTYLMVQRLLEVREKLGKVLELLEWDNLATSEWKTLENIQKLLKPFAQYTSLIGGEDYSTISSVIPIVMELNLHLEETKKCLELKNVSCLLQSELKRRFRKYTDPNDSDYEPFFLMSTMLDPRYRVLLNSPQAESTKKQLLKRLKDAAGHSDSPVSVASETGSPEETDEPPAVKRFHHLSRLIEEKTKEGIEEVSKAPPGKRELEHYLQNTQPLTEEADALQFWIESDKTYPLLSSIALDLLTIPGSSTPVERVFSVAGESTSGKRNRLADQNLEREIILRKNKLYY